MYRGRRRLGRVYAVVRRGARFDEQRERRKRDQGCGDTRIWQGLLDGRDQGVLTLMPINTASRLQ